MKIEEEIDVQQERIAELESQLAQANTKIERLSKQIDARSGNLTAANLLRGLADADGLRDQLAQAKHEIERVKSESRALRRQIDANSITIVEQGCVKSELRAELAALKGKVSHD